MFEISRFHWSKCIVECAIYSILILKSAQARCDLDHVRAIFDQISNISKVGRVVESFDDKMNTIFMNIECVLPEKEKGIDENVFILV